MKYVLFLLLFSTPPAQHVDTATRKAKSVWTLKSSTTMEFSTPAACRINGQTILDSLDETDTVTGVGWCFCESSPGGTCPESDSRAKDSRFETLKMQPGIMQIKPHEFSIDGSGDKQKTVDINAVKLLPKSLQDAQEAAQKRSLSKPKR
ncbi:hypothetical protein [Bradyrhizobium liaoningense]|uniref:hypothetical protein n=1 Tax=Bradyrhizobium liaoningense TaxID=43992 RepID=UPI001BA58E30|nr:hypothetical protein [Bradyrhizobium liaoningense]MBR0715912.1 hypothetical protein [Bradyrhizobium liaoningense]